MFLDSSMSSRLIWREIQPQSLNLIHPSLQSISPKCNARAVKPRLVSFLFTAAIMAPRSASIQSFFKSSKPATSLAHAQTVTASQTQPKEPGDGFTAAEVEAVLHPIIDESWVPGQDYEEFEIANLVPGPKCVTIQGRVANFYDQNTPSKKPRAAKGCVKIIVKDGSGALTVSTKLLSSHSTSDSWAGG